MFGRDSATTTTIQLCWTDLPKHRAGPLISPGRPHKRYATEIGVKNSTAFTIVKVY